MRACIVVVGLAGAACAPLAPPPGASAALTQAMPGVIDARGPFAAVFAEALRHTAAEDGVDTGRWLHPAATAAAAPSVPAIRTRFAARAAHTAVLVVPGLFGDCVQAQSVPFGDGIERSRDRSGIDGYRQYDDLGLHSITLVDVPGRESSTANARRVADAIRREAARADVHRIVVVGYSKGVPDAMQALAELQAAGGVPAKLLALVSVAGAVRGTPVAERFGSLYEWLAPHAGVGACSASDGGELTSLTPQVRNAWLAAHRLPRGVHYHAVVAHATAHDTAPALRLLHAQLDALDARNDGQMLAVDAILPGSTLLAEARTDHWAVALPLERHPNPALRAIASAGGFPREALFRALMWWVVGAR